MICVILIITVLFLAATAFVVNSLAFRPPEKSKAEPDGRRISFPSGKNRLTGYLWNENGTRGLVIFAHGMGTNTDYYLPEIHHFADAGFKVFAFEYSGYGDSTGRFYGFPQAVSDLKNAVGAVDDGKMPLILIGHSMGGYAVCAVPQCLDRQVNAVIAYAPFFSSGEGIAEMTSGMPVIGTLMRLLILPVQWAIFRGKRKLNGVRGLLAANAPSLILQGKDDIEVTCDGCSIYAHRSELAGSSVAFRLIEDKDSSGHMTVIRKKGSRCVNEDTMRITDDLLRTL